MKTATRFWTLGFVSALLTFVTMNLVSLLYYDEFDPVSMYSPTRVAVYSNVPKLREWHHRVDPPGQQRYDEIHIAFAACNDRVEETLVMLKSAILLAISPLRIYAFVDEHLTPQVDRQLTEWQATMNNSFTFVMMPIAMPIADSSTWKKLFRPCSAQRLFFPSLLKDVDSVIYLDTDTLLVAPVDRLWHQFSLMNSSQMVAVANESNSRMIGWYQNHTDHPVYGELGVNAGVLLMNLTRLRAWDFERFLVPTYQKYHRVMLLGDQDIINIIFSAHPDKLMVLPCSFNYRTSHCVYGCDGVDIDGITVVHGNDMAFHARRHREGLRHVYAAIRDYELGTDPYTELLLPLRRNLEIVKNSPCGKVRDLFMKSIASLLEEPTVIFTIN